MRFFRWFFGLFRKKHTWSRGMRDYIDFENWKAEKRHFYGEDK